MLAGAAAGWQLGRRRESRQLDEVSHVRVHVGTQDVETQTAQDELDLVLEVLTVKELHGAAKTP